MLEFRSKHDEHDVERNDHCSAGNDDRSYDIRRFVGNVRHIDDR